MPPYSVENTIGSAAAKPCAFAVSTPGEALEKVAGCQG